MLGLCVMLELCAMLGLCAISGLCAMSGLCARVGDAGSCCSQVASELSNFATVVALARAGLDVWCVCRGSNRPLFSCGHVASYAL